MTAAPVELELKFALDADVLARLHAAGLTPQAGRTTALRSVYWDTPGGELAAARLALRVRRTADGWVQTVKGEGDTAFERFEWEAPVAAERPERGALPPATDPRGAIVHDLFDRLAPVFETAFERTAWTLRPMASLAVELAADTGRIVAGEATEPISELEIERLDGSPAAFHRWAMQFAARHDLRLIHASKGQRGLRLAGRLPAADRAVRAAPVAPTADLPTAAAAAQVTQACLAHFVANQWPLLIGDDPGAVHQARVALRRLRAAMRFFGLARIEPGWLRIDALARRHADALGRLRDADVFAAGVYAALGRALPGDAALARLGLALDQGRQRERAAIRQRLAGRDATRLVLLGASLAHRLARAPRSQPALSATFGGFAARRIAELDVRLRKRARRAGKSGHDDEAWHRLRIAAKNLRYALEFASCALPGRKRTRRALDHLAELQQRLGAAQDGAVASATAARLMSARAGATDTARAVALVDGWVAREGRHAGHAEALRLVRRIHRELRRLPHPEAPAPAPLPAAAPESTPAPAPSSASAPASAPASPVGPAPDAPTDQSSGSPTSTSSPDSRTG